MSRQIYDSLRLELSTMSVGQSLRLTCPWCRAEHERSLCVTRQPTGGLYICPRIVCKRSGFVSMVYDGVALPDKPKPVKIFTEDTRYLTDAELAWIELKYQLSKEVVQQEGWLMSQYGRLVFPLYDALGNSIGTQAKLFHPKPGQPKVLTYLDLNQFPIHFPTQSRISRFDKIVVVEDILSATKCSQLAPTCAVLGTNPKPEVWSYLSKFTDTIVLMLDPDAIAVAIKLQRYLRSLFSNVSVIALKKDPKDTDIKELQIKLS